MSESKPSTKDELIAHDMKRLHGMGYAQELFRAMGGFSNFAISFTIISVLSGCVTLFYLTTINGGYTAASIGWPLITIFVVIVALGMAELASAYPTAGGLYYWSSKLGFRGRGGPAWGWFTGWFNLIGQIGITAGIAYGAAITLDTLLHAWFPGVPATVYFISGSGVIYDPATQQVTLLIYAIILAAVALLNIFGVRLVAFLNDISVWWHIVGVLLIVVGVVGATLLSLQFTPGPAGVSPATQVTGAAVHGFNSVSTVFTPNQTFNATGFPLWYAVLLSLLLALHRLRCISPYDRGDDRGREAGAVGCGYVGGRVRHCRLCSADGPGSGFSRSCSGWWLYQSGAVHSAKPSKLCPGNPPVRSDICCAVFLQYVLGHVELAYDLCLLA